MRAPSSLGSSQQLLHGDLLHLAHRCGEGVQLGLGLGSAFTDAGQGLRVRGAGAPQA